MLGIILILTLPAREIKKIYVELPMLPNSTVCQQQVNAEDQINIEIVKRVSCDMIIMRALPSSFHKCVHVLVMQKCVQVVTKGTRDQCRKLGRNSLMVFRKKFNRNNRNQNYKIIKSSKLVLIFSLHDQAVKSLISP